MLKKEKFRRIDTVIQENTRLSQDLTRLVFLYQKRLPIRARRTLRDNGEIPEGFRFNDITIPLFFEKIIDLHKFIKSVVVEKLSNIEDAESLLLQPKKVTGRIFKLVDGNCRGEDNPLLPVFRKELALMRKAGKD